MAATQAKQRTLIWPLIRLTVVFFLAQVGTAYFNLRQLLSPTPVNHFIMTQVMHSPTVLFGMAKFAGAQILLYAGLVFVIWAVTRLISYFFRLQPNTTILFGMLLWFDAILFILLANQLFFPYSQFAIFVKIAQHYSPVLASMITIPHLNTAFFIVSGLLMVATAAALASLFIALLRQNKVALSCCMGLVLVGGGYYHYEGKQTATQTAAATTQPNVVLISIDYFRPTDTEYFGNKEELTPNIDQYLKQATVFTHAITPIARTFPSLMGVETGEYPKTNGARHNLIMPSMVNKDNTLAHILGKDNYYSMLATDGSHFFYMDKSYGFNKIVAPPPGLNEFVFSSVNDFPLSNILMNTTIGKHLFPYNYMNRNAYITYSPNTFINELTQAIKARPHDKPLYLHVHLTLAAWPYKWSADQAPIPDNISKVDAAKLRFNIGVRAVDAQFAEVVQMLQQQGVLNHAMLVVLSDHGQAFGEPGDSVTQKPNYVGTPNKADIERFTALRSTIGHGTDVLSLKQYHPLLSFKFYGTPTNQVGSRQPVVALIDIAPTVLDYLHVANPGMDGMSLLPEITAAPNTGLGNRPFFMETEFTLPSVLSADPSITKVLDEALGYYQLNPKTGILEVKPLFTRLIIKGKQRAVLQGHWMLAMYPNPNKPATLVLVNLKTLQWTTDMHSEFARNSPLLTLWSELDKFYSDEVAVPALPTSPVAA